MMRMVIGALAFVSFGLSASADESASTVWTLDRALLVDVASAKSVLSDLKAVARDVCTQEHSRGVLFPSALRRCVNDTVQRTVAAVDDAALNTVYLDGASRRAKRRFLAMVENRPSA